MTQHPDANSYEVDVLLPVHSMRSEWMYVYDRTEDRVVVAWKEKPARLCDWKDWRNVLNIKSLRRLDLTEEKPGKPPLDGGRLRGADP